MNEQDIKNGCWHKLDVEGWKIRYDPKPIPTRSFDFDFVHDEYDGEGDDRCGNASSLSDALNQIQEIEYEALVSEQDHKQSITGEGW